MFGLMAPPDPPLHRRVGRPNVGAYQHAQIQKNIEIITTYKYVNDSGYKSASICIPALDRGLVCRLTQTSPFHSGWPPAGISPRLLQRR